MSATASVGADLNIGSHVVLIADSMDSSEYLFEASELDLNISVISAMADGVVVSSYIHISLCMTIYRYLIGHPLPGQASREYLIRRPQADKYLLKNTLWKEHKK